MPHDTPLISTIVMGLVLAFVFGTLANRFRMPPIVGYLFAGVLVGPFTPGFVADGNLAVELSEIGVILLMFGVGLHFSLKDLLSVRAIAIPGAVVQIGGATALGLGLALLMGWSVGAGLLFGLALSVASTVVLLKALQDRHIVDSERGRVAVGWLIVEDLAMVLALVLIPATAGLLGGTTAATHDPFVSFVERLVGGDIGLWGILGLTLLKLAAFVGFMLIVGRRIIPWVLHRVAHTGNRELFRLAVLAIALGVAAGAAYLFGVSLALGAFFAGMILSESELSHRAANETLPLRDAFAVLFFVSVGMLFDPSVLLTNPLPVLATVFIIVIGKSILAFLIVVAFRRPVGMALTISASLAQIGEFSFILAALGVGLGIMPPEAQGLIVAGALISIVLNPVVFWGVDLLKPWLENRSGFSRDEVAAADRIEPGLVASGDAADMPAAFPTTHADHTVVIGYGRVGRVIAEALHARRQPFVIVEDADLHVATAREAGYEVIAENGVTATALALANVASARQLLVAIPNAFEAGQVVQQSRKLNPGLRIVARGHSDEEETYLSGLGADVVIVGEREIGLGMVDNLGAAADSVTPPLSPAAAPDDTPSVPPGRLPQSDNIIAAVPAAAAIVTGALAADMAEEEGLADETSLVDEDGLTEDTTPDDVVEAAMAADLDVEIGEAEPEAPDLDPIVPDSARLNAPPAIGIVPEPVIAPPVDSDSDLDLKEEAMPTLTDDDLRAADAELTSFAQADVSPEFYDSEELALENAAHLEAEAEPGNPDQTPQSDPAPELPGIPPSEVPQPTTPPSEVPPPPVPNEDPVPPMPSPGPGPSEVPPITPDPGTVPGEVPTVPEQPTVPPVAPPTVAKDKP